MKFLTTSQRENSYLRNIARSFAYNGRTFRVICRAGCIALLWEVQLLTLQQSRLSKQTQLRPRKLELPQSTAFIPPTSPSFYCTVRKYAVSFNFVLMPSKVCFSIDPSYSDTIAPIRTWQLDFAKRHKWRIETMEMAIKNIGNARIR